MKITKAKYNDAKLHQELIDGGLPMHTSLAGINPGTNEIVFDRDLSTEELSRAEAIIAAHNAEPGISEMRRLAYQQAFSLDEFMEAFFETQEKPPRNSKFETLQAKRKAIKALYPK